MSARWSPDRAVCGACLHPAPRAHESRCPGCGASHHEIVHRGRADALERIAAGDVGIAPGQRDWLARRKLVSVGALPPLRRSVPAAGWITVNRRALTLTERGQRVRALMRAAEEGETP